MDLFDTFTPQYMPCEQIMHADHKKYIRREMKGKQQSRECIIATLDIVTIKKLSIARQKCEKK